MHKGGANNRQADGFTPYTEDGVIMEAVSHKLDRPLVNPSNNLWVDSTQTKTPTSPFQIGDSLIYTNYLPNDVVEMLDIKTSDPDRIKYIIKLLRGNTMIVTKDFLK